MVNVKFTTDNVAQQCEISKNRFKLKYNRNFNYYTNVLIATFKTVLLNKITQLINSKEKTAFDSLHKMEQNLVFPLKFSFVTGL